MTVRPEPCIACPYRRDAPSGVWSAEEYDKLRDYDQPTAEQPMSAFACHATPDHLCHGWTVVHMNRGPEHELIGLRLYALVTGQEITVPSASHIPLFDSGNEAADHGMRDIDNPSPDARQRVARLLAKYPRLLIEAEVDDDE